MRSAMAHRFPVTGQAQQAASGRFGNVRPATQSEIDTFKSMIDEQERAFAGTYVKRAVRSMTPENTVVTTQSARYPWTQWWESLRDDRTVQRMTTHFVQTVFGQESPPTHCHTFEVVATPGKSWDVPQPEVNAMSAQEQAALIAGLKHQLGYHNDQNEPDDPSHLLYAQMDPHHFLKLTKHKRDSHSGLDNDLDHNPFSYF
jgi:hypothetical protein